VSDWLDVLGDRSFADLVGLATLTTWYVSSSLLMVMEFGSGSAPQLVQGAKSNVIRRVCLRSTVCIGVVQAVFASDHTKGDNIVVDCQAKLASSSNGLRILDHNYVLSIIAGHMFNDVLWHSVSTNGRMNSHWRIAYLVGILPSF